MKHFLCTLSILVCIGCTTKNETKNISHMTEAEKEAEVQAIFDGIGVELPKNWSTMTKQERGQFILKYGLNIDTKARITNKKE